MVKTLRFNWTRTFDQLSLALVFVLAAQTASAQTPRPTRIPQKGEIEKLDSDVRKACEQHFPSLAQESTRTACHLGAILRAEKGESVALKECTKATARSTRPEMACKIGVWIAEDAAQKRNLSPARLKLCQEHYPARIEADTFLQESCLLGVYLSVENKKPKLSHCQDLSKDTTFIGACGSGLSLSVQAADPKAPPANEQNRACMRYFDPTAFHQGYRACLSARALSYEWDGKANGIVRHCRKLTAAKGGDTEAAACVVGGGLLHALRQVPRQENKRFRNCGENKVKWDQRDFLVCLTAASLLDLGSAKEARNSCKEIFSGGRRSSLRNDCYRAVDTLVAQGTKPSPMPTPQGASSEKPDDADLWPESPDIAPEEAEADEQPAADDGASVMPVEASGDRAPSKEEAYTGEGVAPIIELETGDDSAEGK